MTKILFNPRILFGLLLIAAAGAAIATGATGAFFSDNETSTGNTFAAGALDLKIDNDSYYNGNRCVDVNPDENIDDWQWQGPNDFPSGACTTSWRLDDLPGHLFFDFQDIKPDDNGEDTISIHVQNDAWACLDLTLTTNDDFSTTEPEDIVDDPENPTDNWDGELAQTLEFIWWADDGDNVLETGERHISQNVKDLYELATTSPFSVPLADASDNVWTGSGPMLANQSPYYIAKAWCFGTMAVNPVADDADTGPQVRGATGWSCNGDALGNQTQTDRVTLNVQFRAEQARHNSEFLCYPPTDGILTLVKEVAGGPALATSWTLHADGPTDLDGATGDPAVTNVVVQPGAYNLSETGGSPDYNASAWVCVGGTQNDSDTVTIAAGQNVTCTITNRLGSGTLNVNKIVVGGPLAGLEESFSFQVNGGLATAFETDGTNALSEAPGTYDVTEPAVAEYTATYANSQNANLDCTDLNVTNGGSVTCTITNTYVPACVLTGANLAGNGGFETPEVTHASQWDIFASGSAGVAPWVIEWRSDIPASFGGSTRPTPANLELHEGVLGAAFEGNQYTELDSDWNGHTGPLSGEPAATSMYQDIVTEAGATYAITFNWAARPNTVAADNRIRVEWDGVIVHDTGNVADANAGITWIAVGPVNVTATGALTRLRFTDMGLANSNGTFLDNVSVVKTSCGPGAANSPVASAAPTGTSTFLLESFGTGGDNDDVPNWDESSGGGAAGDTRAENGTGTGEGPVSPNGGRYALINDNGYICRSIDATQRHTLQLDYYWLGDNDAEDGESATVQYSTTSCTAGLVTLATHELDNDPDGGAAWASNSLALPASLNGTTFFLRFTNGNQSVDDEDFRVDGVSVSGIATN